MRLAVINGSYGYRREKQVLQKISFELEQGRIMTVLGQNGIGKTTLLKCMMGLLKWQEGQTQVDGQVFESMLECDGIGYVPQAHKTIFTYSVFEMVTMGRSRHVSIFGMPSKLDREKVMAALEIVGISHLKDQLCSQLSGGQLQLVYIARALANEPQILIMDEPESHLDFKNQFLILKLIQRLKEENGISCIINTHYPEHALRISDQTLLLGRGQYVFGPSQEMISEANIKKYFEVNAKIYTIPGLKTHKKAFTVVD
ncbi:ABC transporter ATP-binding protein [Acetobacterium woodii]|uniref:ABC transport system ATP binding protein n=1 Tax=Acetobacterium woodii (strain ATCC 29683 / DSM 1030 / JCM 2381 / KCTC 1655 / WB1) TaxID=931626 RepID=H6LEB5_ACEWD|nr:ABC transporter ATP-binding protein [Acetobacterium woodii]AFA46829.1 ABC transport system ATP binding protein [Acetobacterium woodii DSM 1030]